MAFKVVDGKVVRVEPVNNSEVVQKVNELDKKISPYKQSLEKRKAEIATLDKQIENLTNERVSKAAQVTSYENFIAEEIAKSGLTAEVIELVAPDKKDLLGF